MTSHTTLQRSFLVLFSILTIAIQFLPAQEPSVLEKIRAQQNVPNGSLQGKVTDERSGDDIIGANIAVVNTKLGASTDIEGKFQIKRIPEGTYDVRVTFLGYETKLISGVVISAGSSVPLNIALKEDQGLVQQEVVITATAVRSGEGAILAERKKAAGIGDGISAEQVKKAPDATSSDVLKRVVGLSIVDNKFVFVRGASERYNGTTLNGAAVNSTEVGKKSFAFDMIPSNLLDNTVVIKSATPDLPGDFTGGMVQMNTLDFPERRALKVGISTGWNSITTFRNFNGSQGGGTDWLGSDDGIRALPSLPSNLTDLGKVLPNTWAPKNGKAPMNTSLSLSFGDNYFFDENDPESAQFGFIGALSYRSSFQRSIKEINAVEISRTINGTQDDYSVLWGGMLNLSYKFSGLHKLSFKNNYNQSGDDQIRNFSGPDRNISTMNQFISSQWSQRRTYTGILSGEHRFPELSNLGVDWKGSVSSSSRQDPDRKDVTYYRDIDAPDGTPYDAAINQRSWAKLNGRTENAHLDLSLPVGPMKFKAGSFVESKTTNYNIRFFNIALKMYDPALSQLPLDRIYAPENFGGTKFKIEDASKPTDDYSGAQTVAAHYAMADIPFSAFDLAFRFTGGLRYERSAQTVKVPRTYEANGPTNDTELKNSDLLPSANLTYLIADNMNLRAAYSHTVNRPEFREIASSGYYDFITYEVVGGNPNLKRAFVHNYDLRYEYFPNPGEVLAVSWFSKTLSGAIEEQLFFTSVRTRSWFNSDHAVNNGYELEFRKSLAFLGQYWGNVTLGGNYTRIRSEVRFPIVSGTSSNTVTTYGTRPLQGQSPYMMNLNISFTEPNLGTSVNLMYNRFGKRLDAVGFLTSDIYESPRDMVDLSITHPWSFGLETKFTVKNLLDKERILTQQDRIYQRIDTGITYGLQFSVAM